MYLKLIVSIYLNYLKEIIFFIKKIFIISTRKRVSYFLYNNC